ncbi:pyridoxamine 5'-phosphate oxidase family protein [Paenarthrobacter sp. DKR-5]|uniref:pyridoxamine 5'-phosphate oxidase family protein n=1 Tax=Paenarthrobacter sp. DKR-5 TaxID=2835535 RepID=UPI001BDCF929|nr:pyridoxamine 5'-phosphate oxidase family protein [Paenarthrobacter sp. DKR-5]MBT1001613.1 pyridoxamine 5'-phosphate oxidase family protein [Paenarthrobacter sp. DKR-5]
MPPTETGFQGMPGSRHITEELTPDKCWELLTSHQTGRIGYVDDGTVQIFPVNYMVHQDAIYFRTAEDGALGRIMPQARVSFQIDAADPVKLAGWSVLASGTLEHVQDPALVTFLAGRVMEEPWAAGLRTAFIAVHPETLTGRRVYMA